MGPSKLLGVALTVALNMLVLASLVAASNPPKLVLWAWERPEDLRFLQPDEADVAWLAGTVTVTRGVVSVSPRMQPLRVAPETRLLAVVRIETRQGALDVSCAGDVAAAVDAIFSGAEAMAILPLVGLQVDFDATLSEREAYSALLVDLRRRRPTLHLEITALASWCLFDDWIAALSPGVVDSAVPMVFRMGVEGGRVREGLARGTPFRALLCRGTMGVALDEPLPRLPDSARLYVFNPRSWTRADLDRLRLEIRQ